MGIALEQYRARIGMFVSIKIGSSRNIAHSSASSFVFIVTSVAFIGIIIEISLLIAGIEANPGPSLGCNTSDLPSSSCLNCTNLENRLKNLEDHLHQVFIGLATKLDGINVDMQRFMNNTKNSSAVEIIPSDTQAKSLHPKYNNNSTTPDSVTIIGDNNGKAATQLLKTIIPTCDISFKNAVGKGYASLCSAADKIRPGTNVIIQMSRNEVSYFSRKPDNWSRAWKSLLTKLQSRNVKIFLSGLVPTKIVPYNQWYQHATNMNNIMHDLCASHNIPFSQLWSTFWGQNHLFDDSMLSLNSSGAAVLALQWQKLLTSSHPLRTEASTLTCSSTSPNPSTTLNTSAIPFIPPTIPTLPQEGGTTPQAASSSNATKHGNETARKN